MVERGEPLSRAPTRSERGKWPALTVLGRVAYSQPLLRCLVLPALGSLATRPASNPSQMWQR